MRALTRSPPRDGGFSFIELLAYMAIAALLILAAIPQFNNYRGAARDASTMADVRNVAVAMEAWAIDHPGATFPYVYRNWATPAEAMNLDILASQGVTLSDGTGLIVMDRVAYTYTASSAFAQPGQAFCVFAYNFNGKKYVSPSGVRFEYHSGNGGMGIKCDTK